MISQGLIDSLKKLYKENHDINLTYSQATEASNNLVGFFELLIKVDQRNKQKEHEESKKVQG